MIKLEDIRLNNWFRIDDHIFSWSKSDFKDADYYLSHPLFQPVPLKKEYFDYAMAYNVIVNGKEYDMFAFSHMDGLHVVYDVRDNCFFVCTPFFGESVEFNFIMGLEYVHELQNLYYVLNKEELHIPIYLAKDV